MSYTKKNTKNSPIKNTNMSENTQTKPNDKCPCKSGKKYKKCCFKNKKVEKKHAVRGECPCCCGGGEKLVGMTVWMLDDTECNYGRFCWFDTVYEARKRFEERKGEWCSALIEFKGDAVFAIDRLPCPVCGENEFPSPKREWCNNCEEERIAQAEKWERKQKL